MYGDFLPIDEGNPEEDNHYSILTAPDLSPELLLIKMENYNRLSAEAKEMIAIILNAPIEIADLLKTPKRKQYSRTAIRNYFSKLWYSRFIADITIKEVARWVNQL